MLQAIPNQPTVVDTSVLAQQRRGETQNTQSIAKAVNKLIGKILPYLIGMGILIIGIGWLYGFSAVVLPLTIGISAGIGAGIFIGIACIKFSNEGHRSPWTWFRQEVIAKLEAHGVRDLVVAVSVSVVLAIMVNSPIVGGFLFGAAFANNVVYLIFFPEVHREQAPLTTEERLRLVEERVRLIEARRRNEISATG